MKFFVLVFCITSFFASVIVFDMYGENHLDPFLQQALLLWVLIPVGIGNLIAMLMNRSEERKHAARRGYLAT